MNKILQILPLILLLFVLACKDDDMTGGGTDSNDLTNISYDPSPYSLNIPDWFSPMDIPEDNPITVDGVDLGRHLFYDPILSVDSTMSCADCHHLQGAFTDNLALSTGVQGLSGTRSSMSLVNVGFFYKGLFWDGRVSTLETQALLPVEDPIELHNNWYDVEERLARSTFYPEKFRKAFGIEKKDEISKELAAKAIAQFERTLISSNSKYDRKIFLTDNSAEFTEEEDMGFRMFFDEENLIKDAECHHCHNKPLFTSNDYFNNGLDAAPTLTEFPDLGLGLVTGNLYDNGTFRSPSLRNIEFSAPYMHDGRFETLEEVIDHYSNGIHFSENLDPNLDPNNPLNFTEEEKKALIAFLKTLSDPSFINNPAFSNPFE